MEQNPPEKAFAVIITSYNNRERYARNLDSVYSQKYENYRVIYIDDASPDGTGQLVQSYLEDKDELRRTTLIRNKTRLGILANIHRAISSCNPTEIIAILDGDDALAHTEVLAYLNQVYSDPDVWVTYGQLRYAETGVAYLTSEFAPAILEANAFREARWITSHLKTFYAGLFQSIALDDLKHEGHFFERATDPAYMFPILEMAGKHIRCVPEVLYVYTLLSTDNDSERKRMQKHNDAIIRNKRRYKPLSKLPTVKLGES